MSEDQKRRIFGPSVFVGNIPFGVHEPQIIEWLSNVGQVTGFRLIDDHQTKQSKGYGFATFVDQDTAEAAIRNLNGTDWNGRQIKVDWPNATDKDMLNRQQQNAAHASNISTSAPPVLPPLPQGIDLAPNLTAEDAISKTLNALPAPQLLEILTSMQGMVQQDPSRTQVLLEQSPQLSYAIFQALLNLNLVDTQTLSSIIQATTSPPTQPPAPPPQPYQPPPSQPPPAYPQFGQIPPPGAFPPPANTPQQFQQPYQQPTPQPPPPQSVAQTLLAGNNREQLVQTLLSMSADQIRGLGATPAETEQLLGVWTQLKHAQGR